MIKLVVIDFDDTLCLTEEATFYLENEIARKMGHEPMTRQTHQRNWGKDVELAIVERIPGIDPGAFMENLEAMHQEFVKNGKIDVISDQNLQFLDDVLASGRMLAILTSRTIREVRHLLEKNHPLNSRIEKFYHKDNSDYHKPDPRVFDKILKDFGVEPSETIYLGDSLGDGVSTKGAGLHFIAVLESGLRNPEYFKSVQVDYFATTLPEAMSYISSI